MGRDHHFVVAEFQLKIMLTDKNFETTRKKYDVQKLQNKRKLAEFKVEFRNCFQALVLFPRGGNGHASV